MKKNEIKKVFHNQKIKKMQQNHAILYIALKS